MAALSEADRKLCLGDKYVERTPAQILAENPPGPVMSFLRKLFST